MSKASTASNRSIAMAIFAATLPQLDQNGGSLTPKEFRAQVRGKIMSKTGVDDPNASAMYNFAKNSAVGNGEVAQFGRSTKTGVDVARKTPVRKDGENWAVVNKTTGKVVGYTTSRAKATAVRADGETVKKADAVAA